MLNGIRNTDRRIYLTEYGNIIRCHIKIKLDLSLKSNSLKKQILKIVRPRLK